MVFINTPIIINFIITILVTHGEWIMAPVITVCTFAEKKPKSRAVVVTREAPNIPMPDTIILDGVALLWSIYVLALRRV